MPISWDPNDHNDPAIKKFVSELNQLISRYSLYVKKDTKTTVLIIRNKENLSLMEYQPDKNKMINWYKNPKSCKDRGIPKILCDEFNLAIKNYGPDIKDSNIPIFIELLKKVLDSLFLNTKPDVSPLSNSEALPHLPKEGPYLPTKDDYDNVRRKILRDGGKQRSIEEIMDIMEVNLVETGRSLAKEWRSVTRNRIILWAQENKS